MTDVIIAFILATLLVYAVAAWFVRSASAPPASTDRRRFEVILFGTGGLYAVLHALAFTGLLSVPAVAVTVGVGAAAVVLGTRRAGSTAAQSGSGAGNTGANRTDEWMERLSTAAVAAVCALWLIRSAAGLDVAGTDAAHYHIPHAVNYALGATPWGPMPTPHGYPMGTSLLFAWFIQPFGDAFVVDASMVAWYLVLVASLACLFSSLTGLPGWSWTPWLALVLFGMPLIQSAAYPSADLPYAASFVAVAAQLTWMVGRRAFSLRDWVLLGVSLGLLVGCKAPGVYSAAMLVAAAGTGYIVARKGHLGPRRRPWLATAGAVSLAVMVTGGIWLVRNAWLFGQPVEIYTDRYHLSILQDVKTVYGGDWLYGLWRAGVKIRRLLGPDFLLAGAAIAWLCVESLVRVARRRADGVDAMRLWFVGLMVPIAVVHVAGLVGAPWTSLEWTDGQSLRYLLPFWILYALLASAGLFSRFLPWQRYAVLRTGLWLFAAGAALRFAVTSSEPGGLALAGSRWPGFVVLAMAFAALQSFAVLAARRPGALARRVLVAAGSAVVLAAVAGASAWLADRHSALRSAAEREESAALAAWMAQSHPTGEPHRQVYLDIRADEQRQGRTCQERRFFVASRFDLPLALQPAVFTSQVFDSRRFELVLPLLRRNPRVGTCDYAVVDREETQRQAIRLSSGWLRPIESTGRFLVFEINRPGAERRDAPR